MADFVARARLLIAGAAQAGAHLPPRLSVSACAQLYRKLSKKSSAQDGAWNGSRIPFLNAIMDALGPECMAERVTFKKSSQVGGSEAALNWLLWIVLQFPAPVLVLMPTQDLGMRWVRGRFRPMILESPALRRLVPMGRGAGESNTLTEYQFPGGMAYIGSANIPSDVSAVAVCYVMCDEVDRMPRDLEKEGDPIELAWRRTATYQGRRKMFLISTPTDEHSPIDKAYAESSRGRYYVPCPHCSGMQYLQWSNLEWPKGKPEEAAYRCEHCDQLIHEASKKAMLAAGEWRHERPELCAVHIGFHVNCLYTPTDLGDTWAENARQYEIAEREPRKLQVFTNTRLGEVHRNEHERVDWEVVRDRREKWQQRTIPDGYHVLTNGVDVQGDRLEAQILAWGPNDGYGAERCAVVDYVVFRGDPTQPQVWDQLENYIDTPIMNSAGHPVRISCTLIDAGYCQHEVLAFTYAHRNMRVYACRGAKTLTKPAIGRASPMDVNFRGKTHKRGAELYWLGVSELKKRIYARLRADAEALPADRFIRFNADLPDNYFRMLCAETFDANKGKWVLVNERNEALDVTVYGFAAAQHHSLQIARWREADWKRVIEQQQAPKGEEKPTRAMPTRAIVR